MERVGAVQRAREGAAGGRCEERAVVRHAPQAEEAAHRRRPGPVRLECWRWLRAWWVAGGRRARTGTACTCLARPQASGVVETRAGQRVAVGLVSVPKSEESAGARDPGRARGHQVARRGVLRMPAVVRRDSVGSQRGGVVQRGERVGLSMLRARGY